MNEVLLGVAARQLDRLIITLPPRHGKSELVSNNFPSWYLGGHPDHRVMLASYEATFAATWGRKARDVLAEYGPETFGVRVSDSSAAAAQWGVDRHMGGMVTAGVGGSFTGRGADVLIVDDPVKNAEEANSKVMRDKVWEWWQSTATSRLEPNAVIIVIMTRWHQDDLVGRLLADQEQGGDKWAVLNLPALAEEHDLLGREPGEALWRDRYPEAALARIKRSRTSYWWLAMYQQRPLPPGGKKFRREWFEVVQAVPPGRAVRYWDNAASEEGQGDFTAGTKMVRARDGYLYVEDVARFQESPAGVERSVRNTASQDGRSVPIVIEEEPGSAGKSFVSNYQRRVLPAYEVHGDKVTGSKEIRADYLSAQAENGLVRILEAEWNKEWLDELESFPMGVYDDQVDSASGAANYLAENEEDDLGAPVNLEKVSLWNLSVGGREDDD